MAAFDLKSWLDAHVVPLTKHTIPLHIYSFIWNGSPPNEVLVWMHTGPSLDYEEAELEDLKHRDQTGHAPPPFDPGAWPKAIRMLLEEEKFRFDFLREQTLVNLPGGTVTIFGGDGAPLYNAQGMASARLFRKEDDGVSLILQVGCQYPSGEEAAAATKGFYQSFDESPLEVCQKFGTTFGQA